MFYLILYIAGALVVLSLLVVCVFAVYLTHKRRKFAHIPSPPISSFFMGHVDDIVACRRNGQHSHQRFLEWHLEYGKVVLIWLAHMPFVLVGDPEVVKDALVVKNLPKHPLSYANLCYLYGQRFLGDGLVTNTNGERWNKRRGVLNPAFHRKCLKELMSSFNSTANLLLAHLGTMANGKTEVCMLDQFAHAALDVICKVAFGMDMNIIGGKDNKFTEAVKLSFHGCDVANFEQPFHKWNVFQYPFQRRVIKAVQFLRETGRKVIEVRKNAMNKGEEVPDDILQHIIKQQEVDPTLEMEDMLDDFVSFFIGGHETTASLMAFCLLELGDHPEIMASVVGEVFDVLGDKQNVAFDDLAKLHQLGLVLKETLRLHPPAAGTLRTSEKGQEIGGYKIPADTAIMVSTFVSSHSPEYWTNPEEFNPYRLEDEEHLKRSHYTSFPFSLGPRNCIGQNFAQIEAKVLMSRFLQTFKFSLVPGQSRKYLERVTIRPKDGVMCTLTKRH